MIKKLFTLTLLVVVVLSNSLVAFAEEIETKQDRPIETESRMKPSKEARMDILLSFFQEYNSGEYDGMVSALNKHEAYHLNVKAYCEALKLAFQAEKEAIKLAYESGQMTQEEFQAYLAGRRKEKAINKADREIFIAKKQDSIGLIKEQRAVVGQALRQALKSESIDGVLVQSLLSQMLDLLNQHNDVDIYYFDIRTGNNKI